MKVAIDSGVCEGHGLCYSQAPNVFGDDEQGYGHVIVNGAVPPEEHQATRSVVAICPERAISLED